MAKRSGYLTVCSADRGEIYGEFCDAIWTEQQTRHGANHIFSAVAGDGAMQTFRRINTEGISHVAYTFESNGYRYAGMAELLAPEISSMPGTSMIQIETGEPPARA